MSTHLTEAEMAGYESFTRGNAWVPRLRLEEAYAALRAEREETKWLKEGNRRLRKRLDNVSSIHARAVATLSDYIGALGGDADAASRTHAVDGAIILGTRAEQLSEQVEANRRLLERCRALLPGLPSVALVKQLLHDLDARLGKDQD